MDFSIASLSSIQFPLDLLVPGILAVLFAFETYRTGPGHAIAASIAFPITLVLSEWVNSAFLLTTVVHALTTPLFQAAFFLSLFVSVFVLVNRMISSFDIGASLLQAALCGVATAAVMLTCWLIAPGINELWHFGPQIQLVFGEPYRAWWLAGSLLALAIARG